MSNPQPNQPPPKANAPPPRPPQKAASNNNSHRNEAISSADVAANLPNFTFDEMVDLALCAPEIGAVNFNILRIFLRQVVDKTGIGKEPVKMNDVEAHQVDNFKNFVQGAIVASPMPGVLKMPPQGGPGMAYGVKPGTLSPDGNKAPPGNNAKTPRTPKTGTGGGREDGEIPARVSRLENRLESLEQLPGNAEILERAKDQMSVNDMWQIIQLNNRIAAAEAAIQKMASLIEDLARNMNRVKGDTKAMKKDASDLALNNSDLQVQGQDLADKYDKFGDVVKKLRNDVDKLKKGWKKDRDLMEKTLGVDLGKVPSFMKSKTDAGTTPTDTNDDTTDRLARATQTFVHLKDKDNMHPPPSPPKRAHRTGPHNDGEGSSRPSAAPHSPKGQQQQRHPKQKPAEAMIPPETIANMTPEDMLKQVNAEEVAQIPPEMFKKMSPEQRKVLRDIYKKDKPQSQSKPPKKPLNVKRMSSKELGDLDPDKIERELSYEEAALLDPEDLEKMNDKQRQAVQKVIQKGPGAKQPAKKQKPKQPAKPPLGLATMSDSQLATISSSMINQKLPYDEAVNIPPEILGKMTEEQRAAVQKIIDAGPAEAVLALEGEEDDDDDEADDDFLIILEQTQTEEKRDSIRKSTKPLTPEELLDISKIAPEDLAATLTPEKALTIPDDELQRRFTPAQIEEIIRLKSIAPPQRKSKDSSGQEPAAEDTSQLPLSEIGPTELSNMTEEQMAQMTDEQIKRLSLEKQKAVKDAIRKSRRQTHTGEEEDDELEPTTDAEELYDDDDAGHGPRKSGKDREKLQRPKPHHRHHKHHRHQHGSDQATHPHVDIIQGPIPTVGEPLPPMTLEAYLASLPPEEAANMAADAVQRELQKQYAHLQGMQRQLAQDIQDKMEFIYQKLLTEITTQQMNTSPYMAVGGAEQCFGPGVCTGHGMPAGIAVVQFPEVKDKAQVEALMPPGSAVSGAAETGGKVCPGPGVCPGSAVCTYCICQSQEQRPAGTAQEALQGLRAPEKTGVAANLRGPTQGQPLSEMDEAILKEMKSLMMLDLEKIREEMRFKKFGAFDEQDMVERLGAVWEALKILKHNEEALAVKIARQDELLKKLPMKLVEKLNKIPEENLDAMMAGQLDKPMFDKRGTQRELESTLPKSSISKSASAADKEDVQTLFNNLANVIAECTEQKDRIDQLADTTRIMESGMVTKQMLLDALADKADKGLINTKVSYDEFGNTVDELHTQLHNLMVEGYQRNENWKKTTAELAEELAEKLDKVEIAPIRAFFKSHLKVLEDKVKTLVKIVEEPDPAGTRKRLLRDYNCLSCDRMVNITGVTNGPTLPKIGPISAGHTTASQRALELHRMRMRKQFDPDTKNLNALGRQTKALKSGRNIHVDPNQIACDIDVMHVVNRYTGGSHTAVTTGERIASQRRPSTGSNPGTNRPPMVSGGTAPNNQTAQVAGGGEP